MHLGRRIWCVGNILLTRLKLALLASSTLFLSLPSPDSPPSSFFARGCDALQNIRLPGVCTQMWPQPSLPTCSYLCSQFAWSRSQYPGVAPGRSPPSPSDSWGLWHGGRWWRMWSRWGVRQFQYCSQSLTQRLSRRSQGLAGHWQSK